MAAVLFLGAGAILAPAVQAQDAPPRVKAANVVALGELVGQRVTVYGRVGSTATSRRSGAQFLNFESSEFSVVCLAADLPKFKAGQPADIFRGHEVEVTGTLERYQGKLQIKLTDPAQIKLADQPAGAEGPRAGPKKVALKPVGRDEWVSPAGLHYRGRDPDGQTRVAHVLRHARDIPNREGSHGVFDGGEDAVFAAIDEAWELIQKKRLPPQVESGRHVYSVPLGRRIGYLGGRAGAARGHPPLQRLFLVLEADTPNVVTAFPR
jgi:hypothetical protein